MEKIFYSKKEIDEKEVEFKSYLSNIKETVTNFKEEIPKIQ